MTTRLSSKRKKAAPRGSRIVGTDTALDRFVSRIACWKYPQRGTVGVYAIMNVLDGRAYIGSAAKDIAGRWRNHIKFLRGNRHGNARLQSAWNKYGESVFRFVVLDYCAPQDVLAVEQARMDDWLTYARNGYNIRRYAESNFGLKFGPEVRRKLTEAKLGKPCLWLRCRKQSREVVERRRQSLLARWAVTPKKPNPPLTEEQRRKLSESMRGRPGKKGVVRSPEFRARVSATLKARFAALREGRDA